VKEGLSSEKPSSRLMLLLLTVQPLFLVGFYEILTELERLIAGQPLGFHGRHIIIQERPHGSSPPGIFLFGERQYLDAFALDKLDPILVGLIPEGRPTLSVYSSLTCVNTF